MINGSALLLFLLSQNVTILRFKKYCNLNCVITILFITVFNDLIVCSCFIFDNVIQNLFANSRFKKSIELLYFLYYYSLFHSFHTKYGNRGSNASTNK